MGRLTYDSTNTVEFDDRLLAHLQIVIGQKIRVKQSFYFSWNNDPKAGDGRCTIWISPSVPLYFRYNQGATTPINIAWLGLLAASANTPSGLVILPEPAQAGEPPHLVLTGTVPRTTD